MVEKSEEVATDDYGMIEVRTVRDRIDFSTDTWGDLEQLSGELQQEWDHAAKVAGLLDFIEHNIVEFWKSQGLPIEVCQGRHPSADANKASELGLSWATWRYVRDARRAIAAGDQHLAFRIGWLMGQLDGKRQMRRRHGRGVRAAHGLSGGRHRSHESRRQNDAERLTPRAREIERLDRLCNLISKSDRARKIKHGWDVVGNDQHIAGLDPWVKEYNRNRDPKDQIATLSVGEIRKTLSKRK